MRQQGTNIVHGGVSGNHNQFINHNKIVNNGGGGGNGGTGSTGNHKNNSNDPLTIGLGAIAITALVAVTFLRHFEQIYFWLWSGAIASGVLTLLVAAALWRDNDFVLSRVWPALFGSAIGWASLWVLGDGYNAITPDMLQTANHPGHHLEVWQRFNGDEHRLIGENMATVACLAIAIVLNLLMGLHTLFATLARTEQIAWLNSLANLMWAFRAKCGGIASAVFVGVAYLAVSGVWFDLLHRAQ